MKLTTATFSLTTALLLTTVCHGEDTDLTQFLPPNAVAIIHYAGGEKLSPAYEKSALGQIFNDLQMQAFLKKPKDWIYQQVAAQPNTPNADTLRKLIGWASAKETVVAFYPEGAGALVWLTRVGKDADEARKAFYALAATDTRIIERQSGAYTIKVDPTDHSEFVVTKDTLVISSATMTDNVLARLDGKTPPEKSRKPVTVTSGQPIGWAWLNAPAVVKRLRVEIPNPADADKLDAVMKILGLDAIGEAELAASFDGAAIRSTGRAALTKPASGLFQWFSTAAPLDEKILKLIPKNVAAASASRINAPAIWNSVMNAINAVGTDQDVQNLQAGIAAVEAQLQIMFKEDLVETLGDTMVFYSKASPGIMQLGEMTFVVSLKDAKRFGVAVDQLTDTARMIISQQQAGQFTIKTTQNDSGGRVYSVTGVPMFAPAWTVKGNYLYISASAMGLNAAIAQTENPQSSLLDNEDFQKSRKTLPEKIVALTYEDTRQSIAGIYSAIGLAGATLVNQPDSPLDLSKMPPIANVQGKLFGAVNVISVDDKGVHIHGYSPLGMDLSNIAPLSGIIAAAALPAVQGARQQAQQAMRSGCESNLTKINEGIVAYAKENNGKFPPKLMELNPKHVSAKQTFICPASPSPEGAVTYVYVKGLTASADPKMILAYDADPQHSDGRGSMGRNVLFVSGQIEWKSENEFQKALREQEAVEQK